MIHNTTITKQQLRDFGVIFAIGVMLIFGLFFPYLSGKQAPAWVAYTAIPVGLIGLILPVILKPFYIVWLKIGAVLGWINTRIILTFIFVAVFLPIGFLMKLLRQDPMHRRFESTAISYRIKTKPIDSKKMERPY